MRLVDLEPRWVGAGGDGVREAATGNPVPRRERVGVSFNCPCGGCGARAFIPFTNPLDGGPPYQAEHDTWERTGDSFETLSLTPSIQRADPGGCRWHGYLTDGVFRSC